MPCLFDAVGFRCWRCGTDPDVHAKPSFRKQIGGPLLQQFKAVLKLEPLHSARGRDVDLGLQFACSISAHRRHAEVGYQVAFGLFRHRAWVVDERPTGSGGMPSAGLLEAFEGPL